MTRHTHLEFGGVFRTSGDCQHYTARVAIRVVCFDLGGVVVRIHRTWEAASTFAGFTRGAPPRWGDQDTVAAWHSVHLAHHRGDVTDAEYFTRVAELSAGFYAPDDVARIHRGWLIDEYPGMAGLIGRLSGSGLVTACLSNTNASHWQVMHQAPAFAGVRALATRLASHELKLLKPELEIYRAAEAVFGCSPSEIAFFDDLEANVAAARACGWHAWEIDPLGSPVDQVELALAESGVHWTEAPVGG